MRPPEASRLLLVGDVFVDYHADLGRVRLGGVFHAARALNALGTPFSVAYTAPDYLVADIEKFLGILGARAHARIGEVTGSPAVMVIRESREVGDQGYDEILRGGKRISWQPGLLLNLLAQEQPTDTLLFPGHFPVPEVIEILNSRGVRIHIDTQYEPDLMALLRPQKRPVSTIFCSTSSPLFKIEAEGDPRKLRSLLNAQYAQTVVLKENRGGSRAYLDDSNDHAIEAPSFPTKTAHSVGVGDCFDCTWIATAEADPRNRLTRAAFYSSLYASTWDHSEFVSDVRTAIAASDTVATLAGIRVPWEKRQQIHVYIAAPDFPRVNVSILDALEAALKYHNFAVHRPVRENGVFADGMSSAQGADIYARDLDLLDKSSVLIAVPLVFDPGTFVEMGIASARNRPTILFETSGKVSNLFAEKTATRICQSVGEVVDALFELVGAP